MFFLTPAPLKIRFGEGMKKYTFLVFIADKSQNLGRFRKKFEKDIIFTENVKFSTC